MSNTDSVAGSVLRPLGSFETITYTLAQRKAFNFNIALTLTGPPVPHHKWTTALAILQHSTPALNVAIQCDTESHGPVFVRAIGRPVPVTYGVLQHAGQWCEVAGRELSTAFDVEHGPLLRVVVLEGVQNSEVVFTCHHAIADGMSLIAAIRRLLEVLDKDELAVPTTPACIDMPASADERVAALDVPPPTTKPAGRAPVPVTFGTGSARVTSLTFSAQLTAALRQKGRAEQVTVHSALGAALVLAVSRLSSAAAGEVIGLFTAMDTRPMLGMSDDEMVLTISALSSASTTPLDSADFWTIARSHYTQLKQQRSPAAVSARYGGMAQLAAMEPETLVSHWGGLCTHKASLSNMRVVSLNAMYGGTKVTGMYGPGRLYGGEIDQTVGVVTFNGQLHMLHCWYKPLLPALLDMIKQLIEEACESG